MEQVRAALAWITKYHFWLLSVLTVLISSLVWWLAAGDLDKRKKDNIAKINATFQQQDQLIGRELQPNDKVIEKQKMQIDALAKETEKIWQDLYDRQSTKVLKWPEQLPRSFLRSVESKQFGDEMDLKMRADYSTYITGRFDDLPKLVDANEVDENAPNAGPGFGGGFGGGGEFGFGGGMEGGDFRGIGGLGMGAPEMALDAEGNPIEIEYTVYWAPEDQLRIESELDWPTTQSNWRIWVTQEDLWVYEAMLRAVAKTNESKGADRLSNAAIAGITALQVGRDAARQSRTPGRIKRLAAPSTSGMGGEGMMGDDYGGEGYGDDMMGMGGEGYGEDMMGMGGEGYGEGMMGRNGEMGTGETIDPAMERQKRLSGRYVDSEGKPIPVPPGEEPLEKGVFGQEVKRLPVRMVVRMDTRWLSKLITELANADLQIQVTEVRVGEGLSEEVGGAFGGRGYEGGDMAGMGGMGMGGMGMGGMGMGGMGMGGMGMGGMGMGGEFSRGFGSSADENIMAFNRKPFMKPVIIQGIVLIFNKPDKDILRESDPNDGFDAGLAVR